MKKLAMFTVLVLLVAFTSCRSQSGKKGREMRAKQAQTITTDEKVVIVKIEPFIATPDGQAITYKIKRPAKGVVQFVTLFNQTSVFAVGDTIYCKF